MSYDLNFWKQPPGFRVPAQQVYESLCNGEPVEGLERLPVESFLALIRRRFPRTENHAGLLDGEGRQSGSFQVSWSPQHVRVDCYGLDYLTMNEFIDIAAAFGCALYDPQTGVRYDESQAA